MAGEIIGFGGSVTSASAIINVAMVTEFSAEIIGTEIISEPAFGAVWTSTKLGSFRMTGSIIAKAESGTAGDIGVPAITDDTSDPQDDWADTALVLLATTGVSWTMTAVLTNVSISRPHGGQLILTSNFANTGAVTQAWAVA